MVELHSVCSSGVVVGTFLGMSCPDHFRANRFSLHFCYTTYNLTMDAAMDESQGFHSQIQATETEEQARVRFQTELEFVQCLASPHYLNFLAQRGYFKEQAFINYLKYLLYWKRPEYAKFLKYPQSLHLLELLQYEHFRRELVNPPCAKFIDEQLILHWQYYTRKRMKVNLPNTTQQSISGEQPR